MGDLQTHPTSHEGAPDMDTVGASSSSDGEDLALLEEVKARIEAKLRAKQLKKMAKTSKANGAQAADGAQDPITATNITITSTTTNTNPDPAFTLPDNNLENGHSIPKTPKRTQSTAQPNFSTPVRHSISTEATSEQLDISEVDMTTPTKTTTPLISPGFRTPSPPPRTRYFMSPPSGASARKRQHSPSPMPRRSSVSSMQRIRHGSSTPTAMRKLQFNTDLTPAKAPSFTLDSQETEAMAENNGAEDQFDDLMEENLEALLDDLLDDDDFENFENAPSTDAGTSTPQGAAEASTESRVEGPCLRTRASKEAATAGSMKLTLTEVVQAQKQKREAEQERQRRAKATFYTVSNGSGPLLAAESTRLGHAPDFDPLTGLRIKDRITACDDMARMTKGLRNIPIQDSERIRDNSTQRPCAGILPSSKAAPALTGRLTSRTSATTSEPDPGSWIIAGVIGAKSKQRTTAKKVKYCFFQLCDLRNSAINVFMFRDVMERHHGKLKVGDVVVIMDPKVLHQAERAGTLGVEVEHPDCLLVIGTSSDFGLCEAVKINGESCGKILDRRGSAYCNFHVMMATHKQRNQRGSLIVGTSSIYDLEKTAPQAAASANIPRKLGVPRQANVSSERRRMMAREPRETTYIFDDGALGTSALMDSKSSKKGPQQADSTLSSFLMSQNNPGGQYLRQAKASKDVKWAKDITSPKTPTGSSSELFPSEMIRRMGFDPVTGQFVPGSPKRTNDDLEARERSLRMLAERVKSPPAPMRPLSGMLPSDRKRTIDVKGTTRPIAQPRGSKTSATAAAAVALANGNSGAGREVQGNVFFSSKTAARGAGTGTVGVQGTPTSKKWIDLDDGSSASGEDDDSDGEGSPLLSLSQQRAKNLMESRGAAGAGTGVGAGRRSSLSIAAPGTVALTVLRSGTGTDTTIPPPRPGLSVEATPISTVKRKPAPQTLPSGDLSVTSKVDKVSGVDIRSQAAASAVSGTSPSGTPTSENHASKKQRFIDFSDSE